MIWHRSGIGWRWSLLLRSTTDWCCGDRAQSRLLDVALLSVSGVDNFHAFQLLAALTVEQLALKLGARVCTHRPKHWIGVDLPSHPRHRTRDQRRRPGLTRISLAESTPPN